MEQLETCKICRKAIAKYTCRNCGAHVCESCYDKSKRICIICRPS